MKKYFIVVLVLALSLMTTGCGTKLIKLTDSEREQIVQFSAHIISEFNRSQPEGYRPLNKKQIQAIKEPQKEVSVQENTVNTENTDSSDTSNSNSEKEAQNTISTLTEAIGVTGIEATCKGYTIQKDYVQDDVFAMNAEQGKEYVVVKIELKNTTGLKIRCNILDKKAKFSLQINDGEKTVDALTTLLTNDFSTFDDEIKAGKSKNAVLIFEVEKGQADNSTQLALQYEQGSEKKQILIN